MGTNYYLRTTGCSDACAHCSEVRMIHLGKSSVGWKFGFRAQEDWPRDEAYMRLNALVKVHLRNGGRIEDEYGRVLTKQEFQDFIESKQHLRSHLDPRPKERAAWRSRGDEDLYDSMLKAYFDSGGYDFCDRPFS